MDKISIRGARVHNLKNIDLDIPRDKLVVITGLSGSGKSSLAFDTIYAEGQRRYVESLSSYARQFLSVMEKPDVDLIEGLSPAISIEQKSTSHNPRSTVGTITEIYDYLRLLFARVGIPKCPTHNIDLQAKTVTEMVDEILTLPENEKLMLLAPVVSNRKGEYKKLLTELNAQGFIRARIDGEIIYLDEINEIKINPKVRHTIEIVVDRLKVRKDIAQRLAESIETALGLANGIIKVSSMEAKPKFEDIVFSAKFSCVKCGYALEELNPRLFSFNSPQGACAECSGLGMSEKFNPNKVIENKAASLADGAIYGWGRSNTYFFQVLSVVANHYKFNIETPYKDLKKGHKDVILYGSGSEKLDFSKIKTRHSWFKKKRKFEGVIPYMQRRYNESDLTTVKENLSRYIDVTTCNKCNGDRINIKARNVFIEKHNIANISNLAIEDSYKFFKEINIQGKRGEIADKILKEITLRLEFLVNIGLEYLSLSRTAQTLSGGESQRIRLASQIGAGLMGVLYVLDEPSIGLHQRDNKKLLKTLKYLRDLGNTVLVVEHDEEAIEMADFIIDIGKGAGLHGGEIIALGTPQEIKNNKNSLTGDYLSGRKKIATPKKRKKITGFLKIFSASGNNLRNVNFKMPLSAITCVTGVSGSGKSTLVNDTLYRIAAKELNKASIIPGPHKSVKGLDNFDKVVNISQSPIGRTPRSNPTTYTGLFTLIRDLFSQTLESRSRGYKPGRFSFNVKGGRCEACKGDGLIKVEMHFLADIYVNCDVCNGHRYNRETLEILYKGRNISQILDMTVEEANDFFQAVPQIYKKLQTLIKVGLSYITLGQNAVTLSGGEAQRIKLAKELSKQDTGNTLYILDEPTTGLHFHDIAKLLAVIQELRDKNNTIVIIEHNLDVIKTADWIVDLGPEGGAKGGEIIFSGRPEDIVNNKKSYTGKFLKKHLSL